MVVAVRAASSCPLELVRYSTHGAGLVEVGADDPQRGRSKRCSPIQHPFARAARSTHPRMNSTDPGDYSRGWSSPRSPDDWRPMKPATAVETWSVWARTRL